MLILSCSVAIILPILFLLIRLIQLRTNSSSTHRTKPSKTMIILGSGGHTSEMLQLIRELDRDRYTPRIYIAAATDKVSEDKVFELEKSNSDFEFLQIVRSRHVGQSYSSSVISTLQSTLQCIPLVCRVQPDLVLCNGPGTCVPIALIVFVLKIFYVNSTSKIVFIESYCRVKTISLTGKILRFFVDGFVVQWPQLLPIDKRFKYFGRLM